MEEDIEDKLDFKEFKKTIKQYKAREEEKVILNINVVLDLINKIDEQQAELEKKDKVINEMAEWLSKTDTTIFGNKSKHYIIQQFEYEVEREGK